MTHETDLETLHGYLRVRRADLLAKLDGLGEYDIRRPLTPTGTNLLGLVKHVASVQLGYFGEVFGRPGRSLPWEGPDAGPNDDLWARADESRASIVELHEYSAAHSDETIRALGWDARGTVPWWPEERRAVTLQQVLVHVAVETARHAGHADIVRELVDGARGNGPGDPNIPGLTEAGWAAHRAEVEAAARAAAL
ncbi:MAG: DinB family protein [Herbiconiux sp.]|nr:DinB family protein [Herbiconiux sp.]